MSFVIVASIGSAFATRPRAAAANNLYYLNGSQYLPAGVEGVNFVCLESSTICTYILSGGVYTPYETKASYTPLTLTSPDKPESAKAK